MNTQAPKIARHAALRVLAAIADDRALERQWLEDQTEACRYVIDILTTSRDTDAKSINAQTERRIEEARVEGDARILAMNNLFDQLVENEKARIAAYHARMAVISNEETETASKEKEHTEELNKIEGE